MKDESGIEIKCENCRHYEYCDDKFYPDVANGGDGCNFEASAKALFARFAELQNKLTVIQEFRTRGSAGGGQTSRGSQRLGKEAN